MTYMYRAALYCDDCGEKIIADLRGTNREDTGDTDDFPQGCDPFSTESDTPHHCDGCDGFLGNELTSDGCDYVRDEIIEDFAAGRMDSVAITTWLPFYGRKQLGLPDLEDVEVACAEAHAELARHGVKLSTDELRIFRTKLAQFCVLHQADVEEDYADAGIWFALVWDFFANKRG